MAGGRYSILPGDALEDPRITDAHLRLLAVFGRHSDSNGWLQANQRVLAERIGRSRETVNRLVRDLVEFGYLGKHSRYSDQDGRRLISEYQVLMDRDPTHERAPKPAREAKPVSAKRGREIDPPCDPHITGGCDVQITGGVMSGDHTPCDPQTSHHKNDPLLKRPFHSSHEEYDTGDPAQSEETTQRSAPRPEIRQAAFDRWWAAYPHKVGKGDARRAFEKASRKASIDALFTGAERYQHSKPPDRPWCNPATWLNQERWSDEPGPEPGERRVDRSPRQTRPVDPLFALCQAEMFTPNSEEEPHAIERRH